MEGSVRHVVTQNPLKTSQDTRAVKVATGEFVKLVATCNKKCGGRLTLAE